LVKDTRIEAIEFEVNATLGSLRFDRRTSSINLVELPAELRNKIYSYTFDNLRGHVVLEQAGTRLLYTHPRSDDSAPIVEVNPLQYACRQLYKETRGLEVELFPLVSSVSLFRLHIARLDSVSTLLRRMQKIKVHGF
jgi:hypothetical protein